MIFNSELEMSVLFKECLSNIYKTNDSIQILEEFKSPFGIPDYTVIEYENSSVKSIISFELKLSSWKRGLSQAFKYKSFSNLSILVLDSDKKELILKYLHNFKRSKIGIAVFNDKKELEVLHLPKSEVPYSLQNIAKVLKRIENECVIKNLNTDESIENITNVNNKRRCSINKTELENILY